jgi:predicted cytidylate kinase
MITYSVITLSGVPGTGTTTIAKLLSKKLNLKLVYIGETFRTIAREYKMTLEEFGKFAKDNPEIDKELDDRQLALARTGNIILEGRLSGWMVKKNGINAFSILLTADLETRIKRIMGREGKAYSEVKEEILNREQVELNRYLELYSINYQNPAHYSMVIDTTHLTPEEIIKIITDNVMK